MFKVKLADVKRSLCLKIMKPPNAMIRAMHEANALAVTRTVKGVPRLLALSLDSPGVLMSRHGRQTLITFAKSNTDEPVLLRIMYSLSGTLAAINNLGLTHNDVKADNVMISYKGNVSSVVVTLVDLGLVTRHGEYPFGKSPKGISEYKFYAPEFIRGECPTSESTDVYSFGYLLKLLMPALHKTRYMLKCITNLSLGRPEDRPTFLQLRKAIERAALAINAWTPSVSSNLL